MHGTGTPRSSQTALETLTCLFFGDDMAVSDALRRPLAPAAALILCLLAHSETNGEAAGLTRRDAQFGLRFAFNAEEAGQVATAGFAAAIDAGLATLSRVGDDALATERLRLTERGERMIDVLRNVMTPDWA